MALLTEDLHAYTSVYQDTGVDKNEEAQCQCVVFLPLFLPLIKINKTKYFRLRRYNEV